MSPTIATRALNYRVEDTSGVGHHLRANVAATTNRRVGSTVPLPAWQYLLQLASTARLFP